MLTHPHTRRGEVILETAAIVATLPDQAIINLGRMLNLPGGPEQFARLLSDIGRLAPHEQATLHQELAALTRLVLHAG